MSNVVLTIDRDASGNVALHDNGKAVTTVEISADVSMEIGIGTGFTDKATVSSFKLFQDVSGTKGTLTGTWDRTSPGNQPTTEVTISTSGTSGILVADSDTQPTDELYFFSVQVTDGTDHYDTDPELRIKKRVSGRSFRAGG